ncbi:MAG: Sec-C motif domain protein [Crocinitomicaceae bacterium]|nr:Sec-C motif domain protein [Crocinitomicaceae bacterium]
MKNKCNCPCGREKEYEKCCKIVHDSQSNARTAEDLMRSRYCAFTKAMEQYLLASHHSSTRILESESKQLINWAKSVKWHSLKILETIKGGEDDFDGIVEFRATYFENRQLKVIHERSTFKKEYGTWYYLDQLIPLY